MTLAKCHLLCHLLVQFVWAIGSNHGFSASLHTIRWCNSTSIYVSTSETARANKPLNERETRLEFISSPSLPIITIFQVGRPGYLNCESMRSARAVVCMAFFFLSSSTKQPRGTYTPRSSAQKHELTSTRRSTQAHRPSTSKHTQKYKQQHKLTRTHAYKLTRRCTKQGGVRNKAVYETRQSRAQGGLGQVSLRRGALKSTCGAVGSVRSRWRARAVGSVIAYRSSVQPASERVLAYRSSVQPARERFRSRLPPGGARTVKLTGRRRTKRTACEANTLLTVTTVRPETKYGDDVRSLPVASCSYINRAPPAHPLFVLFK